MASKPHAQRLPGRGWLKHGGRPGNWDNAPRCGAKTRAGTPCRSAAMPNGRCRMHGGKSTGPRTEAGLAAIRASRTKHGRFTQAAIQLPTLILFAALGRLVGSPRPPPLLCRLRFNASIGSTPLRGAPPSATRDLFGAD